MKQAAVPKSLMGEFFKIGRMQFALDPWSLPVEGDADQGPSGALARRILEEKEAVTDIVSRTVCQAFNYNRLFGSDGLAKCRRDLAHVVDFMALCIALDNRAFFEDRMLYWFRRVLSELSFPRHEDSIRAAYTILRQEYSTRLTPSQNSLAEPFFSALLRTIAADDSLGMTSP